MMTSLAELLVELTEGVPLGAEGLRVTTMEVDFPIEARLDGDEVRASFPRGRLATAFDPALSRLAATFEVRGD